MRKWIPFSMLFMTAFITAVYLLLTGQTEDYYPDSSDPALIYQQACADCHGKTGEGSSLLYPALGEKQLTSRDVIEIIRSGAFMMPAFPNIPDTTLLNLSAYIIEKGYLETAGNNKQK
jgi:mono/diheme cytochrome c family protein